MKIIFAGGGTGGHLFSGIALAETFLGMQSEIQNREVLFVGTKNGLEKTIVPQEGYRVEFLPVRPLKGKGILDRLKTFLKLPEAFLKARNLLRNEKPDLVIGIGGYASGPLTLLARFMGIRTAIVEQNSYPGITNRILGKFVHHIFIAFEKAREFFPAKKTILTGNPVRQRFFNFFSLPDVRGEDRFTLLILGGSQGAHSINQAMKEAVPMLAALKDRLYIVHQTGKADKEDLEKTYVAAGVKAEVFDFIQNIPEYYARADLVIARSGAGTVTELENSGKPSILIPYPFAADDHQRYNALELVRAKAARMILNHELNSQLLFDQIEEMITHPEVLSLMSENAKTLAKPHASLEILKQCGVGD